MNIKILQPIGLDYDDDMPCMPEIFNLLFLTKKHITEYKRYFVRSIDFAYYAKLQNSQLRLNFEPIYIHLIGHILNVLINSIYMEKYRTLSLDIIIGIDEVINNFKEYIDEDLNDTVENEMESTRTLFSADFSRLDNSKIDLYRFMDRVFSLSIHNKPKIKLLTSLYI